jgi:hypothetical protein
MARKPKEPRIVAELGRPETPEEKAERLAEQSRKYRARKTINNLILSLGVTVVAAFVIYLMVPHSDQTPNWEVDYVKIGAAAQAATGDALDIPMVPQSWKANQARLEGPGADQIVIWRVGFITPSDSLATYRQGLDGNPAWVASILKSAAKTGTREVGGLSWDIYDNRSVEGSGNLAYAMVTVAAGSTFVLNGTASDKDFDTLAAAVAAGIPE